MDLLNETRPPDDQARDTAGLAPLLASVEQSHRVVGLGRSKFLELIAAGEIETVTVGRRRLVVVESLSDFVARLRGQQGAVGGE